MILKIISLRIIGEKKLTATITPDVWKDGAKK
jgi:hypothetical protein